jgi:D-beta-D-heptose 7-phosphate kinase/D-beta-D-heptose 1-phosphate adenosyltransferase
VLRIDTESAKPIAGPLADLLVGHATRLLEHADALLVCDYAKGAITTQIAQQIIQRARQTNLPVVVDPKGSEYTRYRGATLIKPNLKELEQFYHRPLSEVADFRIAGEHLARELKGTAVLLTQGPDGMTLFRNGEEPWHQPTAIAKPVYDVTGAGDTVVSMVALAASCGAPLKDAVRLANVAAGIVVGKLGTAVVYPQELRAAFAAEPNPQPPGRIA